MIKGARFIVRPYYVISPISANMNYRNREDKLIVKFAMNVVAPVCG